MRKMIAAAAVLAVTSAHAAEELKFGDVNYLFKTGEVNLRADINSVYNKAQTAGTTAEERGYVLDTTLTYGVMDNLNVFLGLGYAYDKQTEISGDADTNNDGLATPAVGAIYRLMNQSSTSYNIDLGATLRYSFMDSETGSDGSDGNFTSPRDSVEVYGRIGRKWNEANEWQLAAGLLHNLDGETEVQGAGGGDVDIDGTTDLFARAVYQYRPVNEFMMELSLQATQVAELEYEGIEEDSHLDFDFGFTAKYLITEAIIGRFNYKFGRNSDYDITDDTGATAEVEKRRENSFGVGVDFLF